MRTVEELPVFAVSLGFEVLVGDEPEGGRVDAVAQAAFLGRAVVEDMAEMTVPVGRANLGPDHPVAPIFLLHDIVRATSGTVKLGQPHPLSNFCLEANRGSPDTTST